MSLQWASPVGSRLISADVEKLSYSCVKRGNGAVDRFTRYDASFVRSNPCDFPILPKSSAWVHVRDWVIQDGCLMFTMP